MENSSFRRIMFDIGRLEIIEEVVGRLIYEKDTHLA